MKINCMLQTSEQKFKALNNTNIVLEIYGHSNSSTIPNFSSRINEPNPSISFLPALSKPVPISSLYSPSPNEIASSGQTHSRYDLLVWWEILELDVSGEYKPVPGMVMQTIPGTSGRSNGTGSELKNA